MSPTNEMSKDGSRADYPMYYRASEERLAKEQRHLSRCKKGSRNYEKQRKRLAWRHEKVRDQRKDFLHKLSRRIADTYDAVAVEDLDMQAMSRGLRFGTRGDSLLMLSPSRLSNRNPPLLSDSESGGSMSP